MPTISVVIPTYNAERTIGSTLESVLNQSFTDFELIIINDGSTDKTLDVIAQYTDSRIRVFSYPNSGPQKSRNRGLEQASGRYISFIDADDLWTADKLEAQLSALEAHPEAKVAYSWTDCIDETGKFLRPSCSLSFTGNVYSKLLVADFIASGSNPLIDKAALIAVGQFDESLPAAQDWETWIRLASCYQFVVVPQVQILYRVSSSSWSANLTRMERASLQVINKAFSHAPEYLQPLKSFTLGNRYKYLAWKALDSKPTRYRGLLAARFLWNAVKYDPILLKTKVTWKAVVKTLLAIALPTNQAFALFQKMKKWSDTEALLVHTRGLDFEG